MGGTVEIGIAVGGGNDGGVARRAVLLVTLRKMSVPRLFLITGRRRKRERERE